MAPSEDEVTSLTAIGGDVQHGPAAFTTTHWSVVLEAQGESSAAQKALEKLCRTYWRPIYGYMRRHGAGTEDAEDLTQGFFALLLERKDLKTSEIVRPVLRRPAPLACAELDSLRER